MENSPRSFSLALNRKLVFGKGTIFSLPEIASRIGNSALVILSRSFSNSETWNNLETKLSEKISIFVEIVSGEPTTLVVDNIVEKYRNLPIELVIGIGGGSVIDTCKAVSAMLKEDGSVEEYLEGVGNKLPKGLKKPLIAVPTTFGTGSEATKNAVISKPGKFKRSLRHDNFVPDVAIIDPEIGYQVPVTVRVPSGLDALTQLIEAYTSLNSNPYSDALCEKAFSLLKDSLEKVIFDENPSFADFANVALGAYLSGVCLANAGLGVVHGFASVIGGLFNIPHGVVCGKLLYISTLENLEALEKENNLVYLEKYANIGNLLSTGSKGEIPKGIENLKNFLRKLHAKSNLKGFSLYGISETDIPTIVQQVSLKENPVKLPKNVLEKILVNSL